MKIVIASVLCTFSFFSSFRALGQEFRLKVNSGYGLSLGSVTIGNNYTSNNGVGSIERVKGSFGQGVYFGGSLAYFTKNKIGFECGINYTIGRTFKTESTSYYFDEISGYSYSNTYNSESSANMLNVTPSVVLSTGWKKLDPYVRLGLVLGVGTMYFVADESGDFYTNHYEFEYYGGVAFGVNSAFGVSIKQFKNSSFFLELNNVNMSYAPTKGKLTALNENGIDNLSSLSTHDREVEFVNEYSFNNYNADHEDSPDKAIKMSHPFGSIGLNIGFVYKIPRKVKD